MNACLQRPQKAARLVDHSLANRIFDQLERRFAKLVFVKHFLRGDQKMARRIGVPIGHLDLAIGGLVGVGIALRVKLFELAEQLPVVRDVATARLVRDVRGLLAGYGRARFTTDAAKYRPTTGRPAPAA